MKRILSITFALLMATTVAWAKPADDLSKIGDIPGATYVQAQGALLRAGLNLMQYGIPPQLSHSLTKLQVAVLPTSCDLEEARKEVRRIVQNEDVPLQINNGNANIKVWGSPDKNDIYHRVVIGIGTRGKLTYILMEGEITGDMLTTILSLN